MDETNLVGKTIALNIEGLGVVIKHEDGKIVIQIGHFYVIAYERDLEPNDESETTD